MNENISLNNLNNLSNERESEEYHEIRNATFQEPIFVNKNEKKLIKQCDFFACYDNDKIQKLGSKKKRIIKKDIATNIILDDINSESVDKLFLIENNIIMVDDMERGESYLKKKPKHKLLKLRKLRRFDAEHGHIELRCDRISPIFSTAFEPKTSKYVGSSVQYAEPSLFSDVMTEYFETDLKRSPKFLDIVINNIILKYHYKFSLEKLVCEKLIEYYNKYEINKMNLKEISKNIDVNRITRNNLKEHLLIISSNKKEDIRYDKSILKYTKAMLEYKEKYYHILKEQRNNIHQILALWEDIKMLREKSDTTKTEYILQITNKEIDDNEFEKHWNDVFEMEYSDMLVKIEYDYINKYLEYKEHKRSNTANNDMRIKIAKPKIVIDKHKLNVEVESIVNLIVLKTNINLELRKDPNITTFNKRRTITNDYCFKVFVDDVFVCESDHYLCKEDQSLMEVKDYLSIEIVQNNKLLSIALFENNVEISIFTRPLAEIRKNITEASFLKHVFVFNNNIEPTLNQVGSGYDIKGIAGINNVRLKSSHLFKGRLFSSCEVNFQFGWNEKLNNKEFESINSCVNIGRQLKQLLNGKMKPSTNLLTEIINNLYENNVQDNENIMSALKDICNNTIKVKNDFDINENNLQLTRLKLLHLRSRGGLNHSESKTIPLFTNQMPAELSDCLQKSDEKHIDYYRLQGDTIANSIDVQRFIGVKFVEKLNENIKSSVNDLLLKTTYRDVVKDCDDISFRSLFSQHTNMSSNAASRLMKKRFIKECLTGEHKVYVTVLRAFNLSDRSVSGDHDGENIAGFQIHSLRPFVRVSYHGETARTAPSIGCHPTWNSTLEINTRFEPLSTIYINIYDQFRDNIYETFSDDRQSNGTVTYRKCNKWLGSLSIPLHTVLTLGSMRGKFKLNVPSLLFGYENFSSKQTQSVFSEVNHIMKKETPLIMLQITTSISYLGSSQIYHQPVPDNSDNDFIIRKLNDFVTDYINDFPSRNICLSFVDSTGRNKCVSEFLQPIPMPDYEYFPRYIEKTESAVSKSSGYSKSSSSRSSRNKQPISEDRESEIRSRIESEGDEESQLVKHMDTAIRYVSLIPTYEVSETYVVTLKGLELLRVLYGSPLDHTILLSSYFIYLGIKCWIITGFALPRGLSSYVLVQFYHNKVVMGNDHFKTRGFCGETEGFVWYIYDAAAGKRHELRGVGCPLKTVSYVFDSENIWVNIQSSQECESISLDFSKSTDWKTVFNKPLFLTRPISGDNLYSKPGDIEELRLSLETKIKNKFQKWRSHVKTIWNRYCSSLLRETLAHWEQWSFHPNQPRPTPGHRLKQLMATYKIFGFPLNMPYSNSRLIASAVKSTAIHMNDDPNVEYAIAVEMYSYPNNVISVWVFLASIKRD